MNEETIKTVLQASLSEESVWRIADPASQVVLSHREGSHYMMIPSNSTPFDERMMAGSITWKLVNPIDNPAKEVSALILRFPSTDSSRLFPFLLELIEASNNNILSATIALEIAKEWESLWKKESFHLTKEQQRGLIAELVVLRNLLKYEGFAALSMWKGPEGGLHDFILKSSSLEVKSHGKISKIITVSRLNQLEPLRDTNLLLCCVGLSRSESGTSLATLIQEVHDFIPPELRSEFINKLKEVKYNFDDAPLYTAKYVIDEVKIGRITEDSNTLHRGKLKSPNPALKDALYKLDSSLLDLEFISLDTSLGAYIP